MGVKRQIMLTGDSRKIAKPVAEKLGLDEFFAELLPQQKVEKVEELMAKKAHKSDLTAFVGDGINDVPLYSYARISGWPWVHWARMPPLMLRI